MQPLHSSLYRSDLIARLEDSSGKGLRALTLLTAAGLSLVVTRGLLTGNWWFFVMLTWNLALAWFPLGVVLVIRDLRFNSSPSSRLKSPWLLIGGLILWLSFLPNAPYIITDLFHIKHIDQTLLWFDTMTIFLFALTGLLAGLYSILIVHRMLRPITGDLLTWALILASQVLSGFGIYLGRMGRWNSWDILTRPSSLTLAIARAYHDHVSIKLTLAYGFILIVLYVAFYWFTERENSPTANE
ncbi:hypothetical protein GCM10028805_02220 [Spirosoma harenae]